jgi:hypothetical protein
MSKKLIKNKCEIESCNITDSKLLELHHIIERTELNTTNNNFNLAILCCNHHKMIDDGKLKIIGVFPSTKLPNARTLVYELDGKKNIDIDVPYVEFKNKSFKIGENNGNLT